MVRLLADVPENASQDEENHGEASLRCIFSFQHNPLILSTVCQPPVSSEFSEAAGGEGVRQLLVTCSRLIVGMVIKKRIISD